MFSSDQKGGTNTDPFMTLVTPVEQWKTSYTISTVKGVNGDYDNYINVAIKSTEKDQLFLDSHISPSIEWVDIGSSGFSGAKIHVSDGIHTLNHDRPNMGFSVFSYGHTEFESYGYPGGMRVSKLYSACNATTPTHGDGVDNDCDGKVDEEICDGADDDTDGQIDEDCSEGITDLTTATTATTTSISSQTPTTSTTTTMKPATTRTFSVAPTSLTPEVTTTGEGEAGINPVIVGVVATGAGLGALGIVACCVKFLWGSLSNRERDKANRLHPYDDTDFWSDNISTCRDSELRTPTPTIPGFFSTQVPGTGPWMNPNGPPTSEGAPVYFPRRKSSPVSIADINAKWNAF